MAAVEAGRGEGRIILKSLASALALVLALGGGLFLLRGAPRMADVGGAVAASHRALGSPSQPALLPSELAVDRMAAAGFPRGRGARPLGALASFEGGAVVELEGQVALLAAYRVQGHWVSCHTFRPLEGDIPVEAQARRVGGRTFSVASREGLTLLFWRDAAGLVSAMVSDLGEEQLLPMALAEAGARAPSLGRAGPLFRAGQ